MIELLNAFKSSEPFYQIVLTILTFILYLVLRRFTSSVVLKRALSYNFEDNRSQYIRKTINAALSMVFFVLVGMIWEISLQGLSVYIASVLTIVGVGLFATWSIVSNITASVILFFFFPFRIGSKVRIVDGDNSAEGEVIGLSLFSIQIERQDGQEIYYPNNLAIQKSIVHLKQEPEESVEEADQATH